MPAALVPFLVVHVTAVLAKLSIFVMIPRLKTIEHVRSFLKKYRPFERGADWVLWITGLGLLYFASWKMLRQTWMIASIALYLLVFFFIRFALTRELQKIAGSKKLLAKDEFKRLRTNNWCVATLAVAFLGIIAYLMITKP